MKNEKWLLPYFDYWKDDQLLDFDRAMDFLLEKYHHYQAKLEEVEDKADDFLELMNHPTTTDSKARSIFKKWTLEVNKVNKYRNRVEWLVAEMNRLYGVDK